MELRASTHRPRQYSSGTSVWEIASNDQDGDHRCSAKSDSNSAPHLEHDTTTEPQYFANPPRRPRGRPRIRPLPADSAEHEAHSLRRTSSSRPSSTSHLAPSAGTIRRGDGAMASIKYATSHRASLLRAAMQNSTTKTGPSRKKKWTPHSTPPPEIPAAFPSMKPGEERRRPEVLQGSHGIDRLMWDRVCGKTLRWRETSATDNENDNENDTCPDMDDSDVEEENKIEFSSLYPTLRWEIMNQIAEEARGMYQSADYPVQCLLSLSVEDIARFRDEALHLCDNEFPMHIVKWKLEHPDEYIDPETPPPGALRLAYRFLDQEKFSFSLLGLWQSTDSNEIDEMLTSFQRGEKDGPIEDSPTVDVNTEQSNSQSKDHRKDSVIESKQKAPNALQSKEPHLRADPENANEKEPAPRTKKPRLDFTQPNSGNANRSRHEAEQPNAPQPLSLATDVPSDSSLQSSSQQLPKTPKLAENTVSARYNQPQDSTRESRSSTVPYNGTPILPTSYIGQFVAPVHGMNRQFKAPPAVMYPPRIAAANLEAQRLLKTNYSGVSQAPMHRRMMGNESTHSDRLDATSSVTSAHDVKLVSLVAQQQQKLYSAQAPVEHPHMMSISPAYSDGRNVASPASSHLDMEMLSPTAQQQQKLYINPLDGHAWMAALSHSPNSVQAMPSQQQGFGGIRVPFNGQNLGYAKGTDARLVAQLMGQQQQRKHSSPSVLNGPQSVPPIAQYRQTHAAPGGNVVAAPQNNDPSLLLAMHQQRQKMNNAMAPLGDRPMVSHQHSRANPDLTLQGFPLSDDPKLLQLMAQRQSVFNHPQVLQNGHPRISPPSIKSGSAQMALAEQRLAATPGLQGQGRRTDGQSASYGELKAGQVWLEDSGHVQDLATPNHSRSGSNNSSSGRPQPSNRVLYQDPATPHHSRTVSNASSSGHSGSGQSNIAGSSERFSKRQKKETDSAKKKRLEMERRVREAYRLDAENKKAVIDPQLVGINNAAGADISTGIVPQYLSSRSLQDQAASMLLNQREHLVSPTPVRHHSSYFTNTGSAPAMTPTFRAGDKRKRAEGNQL